MLLAEDKAYQLMTIKANSFENKLGERTHVETLYEGRTSFKYKVWFCTEEQKISTRIIEISIKGF